MPLETDLLETARRLLQPRNRKGRPRQADLRRAVSTAYYAVFHALCRLCADVVIGRRRDTRRAWQQVYRAVQHGEAKKRCNQLTKVDFPFELKDFCAIFMHLQERRHEADYDPLACFTLKDVQQLVAMAERAVRILNNSSLDRKHKRALIAWVLFPKRT